MESRASQFAVSGVRAWGLKIGYKGLGLRVSCLVMISPGIHCTVSDLDYAPIPILNGPCFKQGAQEPGLYTR